MKAFFTTLSILFVFALFTFQLTAQKKSSTNQTVKFEESLYDGLDWRLVGPFRGGRAGTAAGVKNQPNLYYMGTAGGGVWKTKDGGGTWACISDGYFGGSIGAIAVSESDPNVIYVGEGEETVRGNVSSGRGFWRSTDAGESWTSIGLPKSEHVGRIIIHPNDPDHVYAAVMGNLWKSNPERGVYESKDGGKNWKKILFESDKAGAVDIRFDPNNSRIMFACTWQIKRNGYRMDSGGPGSKLWKSVDSGETWKDISKHEGLPEGTWGISGVAISPVNSDRVWVIIEHEEGGVFRSDDGGQKWTKINSDRRLRQRAWYYSRIYADTKDEDIVYVMNVDFLRSTDGGKNFEDIDTPHGDHHDLWIAPEDNQRMVVADDGGAQVSYDAGENWTTYYNQPTSQFYRVTTDNHFPFRILGAQQDNSTVRILHRSEGRRISEGDWDTSAGGESAHLAPDPDDPEIVFGGTYKGYMMRKDHHTGQTRSVNVWPFNPAGSGAEVMKYRFNWNFPVFFSPHDGNKLYACSNMLHVSYNEGQSWEVISPDLTRADPETIKSSGGPVTQDNTGVEFYANIFAATESKAQEGVIWTGSDDGMIHISKDGGKNWKDVTPPMSPNHNMINCIDAHPTKAGTAYVAATSYKFGDYRPYLYKTNDFGISWTEITNGIEPSHYTRAIRTDSEREGLLFAGTEWGMYVSFDDGANWTNFNMNLPIVAIRDLHVRDQSLIAATHGRSFWMIDDLTPLRELSKEIAQSDLHVFGSKPAYRMGSGRGRGPSGKLTSGENHPNGAIIHYFIKDIQDDDHITLEILETDGTVIKKWDNKSKEKDEKFTVKNGGARQIWNLRYEGFKEFPGMVLYSSPNVGPKAIPGQYVAKLTKNGKSVESTFEVVKDPRISTTQEDFKKQFDFIIDIRDEVSRAHQAVIDIRKTKDDLDFIKEKVKDDETQKDFVEMLDKFKEELTVVENNIHETRNKSRQDALNYGIKLNNHLTFLMGDTQRGDYPPTDQSIQVKDELKEKLRTELTQLTELLDTSMRKIEIEMKNRGIGLLGPKQAGKS